MAKNFLVDLLFPIMCVACAREGSWLCETCIGSLCPISHQCCPVCQHPTARGEVCRECNTSSFLDGATALYDYQSSLPLALFIKKLKYHHSTSIASSLPSIIDHTTFDIGKLTAIDTEAVALQPVPLHTRRERERGFNQAEKIAEAWGTVLRAHGVEGSIVEKKALTRVRYTTPQAGLGALERRKNLSDAFCWNTDFSAPEQVILIDDVITTGSTMQECARELKRHGTKWVWGLALARG